jgi:hypothetical protein
LVIVPKSEREMKELMKSLGKYVRKKKLEVNVEKTKKRKRKSEENEWNWERGKIERVNEGKRERKWRGDFRRRMVMLESMIESTGQRSGDGRNKER